MHLSGGHLQKHPEDLRMNHSCLSTAVEIPLSHFAEANLECTACHKTFMCTQPRKQFMKKSLSISKDLTGAIMEKFPNTILNMPKSLPREKKNCFYEHKQHNCTSAHGLERPTHYMAQEFAIPIRFPISLPRPWQDPHQSHMLSILYINGQRISFEST